MPGLFAHDADMKVPHEQLLRTLVTAAGARERVHTFDLRVRQYLYFCASKASKLSSQARGGACIRASSGWPRALTLLALPVVFYLLY